MINYKIRQMKKYIQNFFFFIFLMQIVFAGTDGTLRGKITDMDGAPLPGTQVYIQESGRDAIVSGTMAGQDGSYIILNIQVGDYDVTCEMMGYRKEVRKKVSIIMDKTQWENFSLPVAAIEGEEIQVYGERDLVEKGSTAKKVTISREAIESLPIRDVSELYTLQSGVVKVESRNQGIPDHEERGLEEVHVRGGRSGEIAYMIDGLYIRNPIFGGIGNGTRLNLFAVKEFDWQPGGFNAEYGDAMSAVSNMHTMIGGNELQYKFKYETSQAGAAMGNGYDELRGYNDYNIGLGGGYKKFHFWVSGQFTDRQSYRVLEFDDTIYEHGENDPYNYMPINQDLAQQNRKNLVQPWDTEPDFRGFGFDKTYDVFGKIAYNFTNRLRMNMSYWQVAAHRKVFNPRYMYWDEGQNELFRDTYRYTYELNHSVTSRTFYTLRLSQFVQDQFQGVRWKDSDEDGYPDWYEWKNPAGDYASGTIDPISDPYNPNIVPYTTSSNGDTIFYTKRDDKTGWFHGATPGNWNWEIAETFRDVNNNGIYDEGIDIFDLERDDFDGDGVWDGPELIEKCIERDGSYWLTPDMYVSYLDHVDYRKIFHEWENDPYWAHYGFGDPVNGYNPVTGDDFNANYFLPIAEYGWDEGKAFGGHDRFYGSSSAVTQEARLDVTSQLTDKWKLRTGVDYKSHKLNYDEIKFRWDEDLSPIRQSFAEYWKDTGPDGLLPGNSGNGIWDEGEWFDDANGNNVWDNGEDYVDEEVMPDEGEGNGVWDPGEMFDDANDNGEWDDFREPEELSAYIQNTFEVPWMVVNAGVRIDGVNYNTRIWSDPDGNPSPNKPWYYADVGEDGIPGTGDAGENDDTWNFDEEVDATPGLQNQKTLLTPAKWFYKVSPRLGISHVITDQATFTFNYGLYYQTPIYQNVYLNTNRLTDPQALFEETEGFLGNATMNATRTESYEFGFNIQMNRFWAFSLMGWVKDMDQLVTSKIQRSGVYKYYVFDNGDYGSAKGIDFTLKNRGMPVNTMIQYTYSVAKANSAYDWATLGLEAMDAPSQEFLMSFDRTHDLTVSVYTVLPFGIQTALTAFYQSGMPYTPYKKLSSIFDTPESDEKNKNSARSPDWKVVNLSLSKFLKFGDVKMTLGMNVFNVFNIINAVDIWPLTGEPDNPGEYYTANIGVPFEVPVIGRAKSGTYYDIPWYMSSPREINFFVRMDFR